MTNTYIDMDGVENVACAMINSAKKDFIKGAKILYSHMNSIPTERDLYQNPTHFSLANHQSVRWMYDSWRFVQQDPYAMFGGVGEEAVINSWKHVAIISYYEELYIKGAIVLFASGVKDISTLTKKEIESLIDDKSVFYDFIKTISYMNTLTDGKEYIKTWDLKAIDRVRRQKPGNGRVSIHETLFAQSRKNKKMKNIKRAKELFEAGISKEAIAKDLGVGRCAVNVYLRS